MEETGKIIELVDNKVRIEITPSGGCHQCSQQNICNPFGKNKKIIELPNTINAQVNDMVKIEVKERNRIISILLILVLPTILFLAGVLIGSKVNGDKTAAIYGGVGLLTAFLIAKIVNNYLIKNNKNLVVIK